MFTSRIPSVLLCALALAWVLPAVPLEAGQCSVVCTETTLCTRACRDGLDFTTCGDYGVCDYGGGGGCTPNYQIVSSTAVALFPVDYYSYCDEVVAYEYTNHDVNNCPGSSDYITCGYGTLHSHPWGYCCLDVNCGTSSSPCSP